jgi:DNA invertase Pin-like site-specific DNA recombinase
MQDQPNGEAVLYAAKSSPDEKGSLPDQLAKAGGAAEAEEQKVVGKYSEENASAYSGNRGPELQAALDHAERIGGSLWVLHSDRLARGDGVEARHLVQLLLEARVAGITLRSVEDDSTFENLVMAVVMGERNMEDSRRKGAATSDGLKRRVRGGKPLGQAHYGYTYARDPEDPARKDFLRVPDPTQTAIVERIESEFLDGGSSIWGIARNLNRDGIAKHAYLKPNGKRAKGKKGKSSGTWHTSGVRRILTSPFYAGYVEDEDGNLIEGEHVAIIPPKRWHEIQDRLATQAKTHKTGRGTKGPHLFRKGFLKCGECDGAMVPRSDNDVYFCYSRRRDICTCSQGSVPRAEIDGSVWDYFANVKLDIEATREQVADQLDRRLAEARSLRDSADAEAGCTAANLARVRADYKAGDISAEDWRELRGELDAELAAANAEAERMAERLERAESESSLTDLEAEVIERLAEIRAAVAGEVTNTDGAAEARAALMKLFDGFILHKGIPDLGSELASVELAGDGYWIEPLMKPRGEQGLQPALTEGLDDAENNCPSTKTIGSPSPISA